MDKEYIKKLIEDYRKAEEKEDYDEFQIEYGGDIEDLCDTLMCFIEKEFLK